VLSDEEAIAIAEALQYNEKLQKLHLGNDVFAMLVFLLIHVISDFQSRIALVQLVHVLLPIAC
jgi:hypothetical protein